MVQIGIRIRGREAGLGKYQTIVSLAALLPVKTCNLWTQELHANGIQTLITHPEFSYAIQLPTIGVELRLAKEDGCSAGFKKTVAARPVGWRNHRHDLNAFLAKPTVVTAYIVKGSPTVVFQVNDQKVRPLSGRVIQHADETLKANRPIAKVANCRAPMFGKHSHEETCRVAIIVDEPNEG